MKTDLKITRQNCACCTDSIARRYRGTLLLTLPALLIFFLPAAAEALQFERSKIAAGEWFRLLTCHWTHWNADHAFWDILMFGVLGAVCERRWRAGLLGTVVGSAIAISASLWWRTAQLETYRGLSGVDSALFAMAAVGIFFEAWKNRHWVYLGGGVVLAVGFIAKTLFEVATGATLFVNSSAATFVPIPLAHAVGAIVGAAAGVCHATRNTVTRNCGQWKCMPGGIAGKPCCASHAISPANLLR